LNFNLGGTAAGGGGDDRFDLAAAVNATVAGDAGTDSLFGAAATASTFTVATAGAGSVMNGAGTVQFSTLENLTGGAAADTFNLNANLTGAADGAGENDVFNLNADLTGTANGNAGDDQFNLAAAVAATVVGGDGADTLAGSDSATTFTVTAANAGTAANGGDSVGFSAIETLAGGSGNDTFTVNVSSPLAMAGNGGNDTFDLANNATASGVLDGGAGSDTLTLGRFTTARTVTLTGIGGTDGFNGTETNVTQGFRNFDAITGGQAPDALTGLNANATWSLGDAGNQYTANGRNLAFASFSTLNGGSASDAFVLNDGTHSGNLELDGNFGANTADVRGSFAVTGDLTLRDIQTITDNSGGTTLAAVTLNILGATTVGESNKALVTNIQNLLIESSGSVFVTEKNGLTILGLDAGTGQFQVTVQNGDLRIKLLKAGGQGRLDVLQGNLLDDNGADQNMLVSHALLFVPKGSIGTAEEKLEVEVPSGSFIDAAPAAGLAGAFINASTGSHLRIGGREFLVGPAGVTSPESLATNNTLLVDVSGVDWASLDPTVTLLDCLEPCVRLPADQAEGEELARARPETRLLLIRTTFGWKMVPVFVTAETAALRE
jgi:acrosin